MRLFNRHDYKKWESKDGKVHNIEDMSIVYIRNCINMMVRSLNPEENKENKEVFRYGMVDKHGEKYIKAFYRELKRRRKLYMRKYK